MESLKVEVQVRQVLESVLNVKGLVGTQGRETPLLGSVPELDSMTVVALLTTLEERFGFAIDDDDVDSHTFATLGSLTDFVARKLAG